MAFSTISRYSLPALLLVAVTMIAACGSDSGGSGSASTGSTPSSAAASTGADPLDGTTWTLDVAGLEVPGAEKVAPTISFSSSTVSGSSGCNTFTGGYTVSGATLTIGQLASTQKACGPAETAVETAVMTRLGKVAGYTVAGDKLTLTDASGATLLTYAAAKGGVEGSWEANGYLVPAKQAFTSPIVGTSLTAVFGPDGHVAGSAGCNDFTGTYTVDGTKLTIGALATTRKACDSPAGIMEQETDYIAALSSSVSFQNDGTGLTLLNAAGQRSVAYNPKA
jgi:heat shock protein HslJ